MTADQLWRILHNRIQSRMRAGLPIDDEFTVKLEQMAQAKTEGV